MVTEVKVPGKVRPHLLQYLPEFHAEQTTKLKMLSRTVWCQCLLKHFPPCLIHIYEPELLTPRLSSQSFFFLLHFIFLSRCNVRPWKHRLRYPRFLEPNPECSLNHRGCCPTYHFVVVMFAVATILHVVSSWAFLLTQETRHLSTGYQYHRVSLQKPLDTPGCSLNPLSSLSS